MKIRVIQWNIRHNCKADLISSYLASCIGDTPTVVCLNEVTESTFETIGQELDQMRSDFSLRHREPGRYEGAERALGVAVFANTDYDLETELIWRAVFPERSMVFSARFESVRVRVAAFHSLTGVGYKKAKASNFAAIADFLSHNTDIDFVCCDANEPMVDSVDLAKREFWAKNGDKGKMASFILGPDAVHGLSDSLVVSLTNKGGHEDRNPLRVSHRTRNIPRRYDHILHSDRWGVESVEYDYDGAIAASSDHAAVIADFLLK